MSVKNCYNGREKSGEKLGESVLLFSCTPVNNLTQVAPQSLTNKQGCKSEL